MKNKRFEIGDEVRVIFSSYEGLAKNFFYQDSLQESCPESDRKIMLGAKYKILDVKRSNSGISYKLLANSNESDGFIGGFSLRKSGSAQTSPFELGDFIKFRPTCSEADKKYLLFLFDSTLGLSDPNKTYKVSRILNGYYIFIEDSKVGAVNYPFRWQEFKEL